MKSMQVNGLKSRTPKERVRVALMLLGFWIVWGFFLALLSWPHPKSALGWILVVVLAPPLYMAGELAGSKFWASRLGRGISEYPSRVGRISLGVVTILCLWLIVYGVYMASTLVVARVF